MSCWAEQEAHSNSANASPLTKNENGCRIWARRRSYQQTKDILKVKKLLGHKAIESTMVYTQLIELHDSNVHQYAQKEVSTKEDRTALVESGWEFVFYDPKDQTYIFRKRNSLLS